jgi:hypothetical protein
VETRQVPGQLLQVRVLIEPRRQRLFDRGHRDDQWPML